MSFSVTKRKLLSAGTKLLGAAGLARFAGVTSLVGVIPTVSAASYPDAAFKSESIEEILIQLFETSEAGEDGGIVIDLPQNPISSQRIPFRAGAQYAEKIALLVHANRNPLIMVADTLENPSGIIFGTLDLVQSGYLSCYVLKQGLLYRHSRWIRTPVDAY